jgi:hypothetical protein
MARVKAWTAVAALLAPVVAWAQDATVLAVFPAVMAVAMVFSLVIAFTLG